MCSGDNVFMLMFSSSSAGPEDRHVLPEDQTCCKPHSVHCEQGEAEGGAGSQECGGVRGGDQGAEHCCSGLLFSQQG